MNHPTATARPALAAPTPFRAWWLTARPHTLPLSLAPVLLGCALAWVQTAGWRPDAALMAALASMLIQIGTNLLNDVGDHERGADSADRLGPPRATAQGWLPAAAVRRAGLGALAAAFVCGIYLVWVGGWPIVALGLLALLCGWAYTAGPAPIAYGPWGEVFVWLFFGVAAVGGTYYLQTDGLSAGAFWLGHVMGALAAAVMLVNNTRDGDTDVRAGKRTLATRIGLGGSRALYALLLLQPFLAWPALSASIATLPVWPWLTLPWALWLCWRFARTAPSRALNALLAHTARFQAAWALVVAISLWLA